MEQLSSVAIAAAAFALIALASREIGRASLRLRLPLISGFLLCGILAGPYGLGLISAQATRQLRFVDEISIAFIAFAAGGELYLKELRHRFRAIGWVTGCLVISTFLLGSAAAFLISGSIPIVGEMPALDRFAVALLAGAILVARSPSSAIAIVKELRARGPFTYTVLGVTVIMDAVVIVLFAVSSSVADAFFGGLGFDVGTLVVMLLGFVISGTGGVVVGLLLEGILRLRQRRALKAAMVLAAGYGVYLLSAWFRQFSHQRLGHEILLEPLLVCMIGGFLVTNYSERCSEFHELVHETGPPVYVAFFTLTGASLALGILAQTWSVALVLFAVRLGGIFLGAFSGGAIAGEPLRLNRIGWMAYITQAGVGLGLAKEVAVEFPLWGDAFATVMIAVIVLNQVTGPPLFKWAIHIAGEARARARRPGYDGVQEAIVFGVEGQALALARQLTSHGWQVKVAALSGSQLGEARPADVEVQLVEGISLEVLESLQAARAECIVGMLDDEDNYRICELAYEHYGTKDLVVRLNHRADLERFRQLGVLVVDPSTAMISLLDHFVRSPGATSILLGLEGSQDVVEICIGNPSLQDLQLRELRLPADAIVLSVRRGDANLISHGDTRLQLNDWVTVLGGKESLEEVMLLFGGW